ncbi:MAG: hypothetical protein CVU39_01670 [Chloroflexi bacterium HGW-Chloroflexi-10]|nr:MAG: hypothetical protein CVU39_01670 [Chloroflexi bacterium HGW-Chloroflexi-10]
MIELIQPVTYTNGSSNRIQEVVRNLALQQPDQQPTRRVSSARDSIEISARGKEQARLPLGVRQFDEEETRQLNYLKLKDRQIRTHHQAQRYSTTRAAIEPATEDFRITTNNTSRKTFSQAEITRLRYEESDGKWGNVTKTGIFLDIFA